jgi:hypothetical protein
LIVFETTREIASFDRSHGGIVAAVEEQKQPPSAIVREAMTLPFAIGPVKVRRLLAFVKVSNWQGRSPYDYPFE